VRGISTVVRAVDERHLVLVMPPFRARRTARRHRRGTGAELRLEARSTLLSTSAQSSPGRVIQGR
jgi:hypothetical protein